MDVRDPEHPVPLSVKATLPQSPAGPSAIAPRAASKPLTPSRPGTKPTEDADQVCNRNVRPVERPLAEQRAANENPAKVIE